MGLFVKNNYLRLLIVLFLIWVFSSCASSENTVEKLEENQKVKEETPEVSNGWIQIGSQKFEMVFTCYKTKYHCRSNDCQTLKCQETFDSFRGFFPFSGPDVYVRGSASAEWQDGGRAWASQLAVRSH